ncbi:hypothetical protein ACFSC3_12375 [Sphingomonas floccifaciens]|uniref:AcrB/AcrD/AcrF family protein n=1 Tax=Sphingomonas floccifaciens TaxID=1844115 RepID=A0ABW4NEJ6_9SPHN
MVARLRPLLPLIAVTMLLGIAWTLADWQRLSRVMLPDTDDAMRLQQIRDWIAGQGFADVSQHRLAGGLAMHWSRIGDVVPAAVILLVRPFTGTTAAEIAAVVLWPLVQFAALLVLIRDLTQRLAPSAGMTAAVLIALAYPASSLFLPGRIDHHALQLLLVLVQLRALLAAPGYASGAVIGGAVAMGAAIGLETLPFAIVTSGIVVVERLRGDGRRQAGFGLALAGGLVVLLPMTGTGGVCDTVQPLLPYAAAGGLALAALARIDRHRLALLLVAGGALVLLAWPVATACLSGPYGTVDPLVARLWLARVGEAQPLLSASPAIAIGYAGLMIAGLIATLLHIRRGGRGWWLLLAYQATAFAITLFQLRGAYVGAALAVVPIAAWLAEARAHGRTAVVLSLWIAGAGIGYPLAAGFAAPKVALAATGIDCSDAGMIDRLAALPPGRVMTGIDAGSYILAGTAHSVIAAPYHRNNAGNAAMYRFFLGSPSEAERIARRWNVRYVALCPGMFGGMRPPAGSIGAGAVPSWLHPLDRSRTLFRVKVPQG